MIYIFLSLFAYAGAILIATYANRHANVSFATLIINIISVIVPAILVAVKWSESVAKNSKGGLIAALLAGLLISAFTLSLGKAYEQNNVAIVVPIIFGGAIVLTSVASIFIFKEKIVPLQAVGLVLVSLGLAMVVYSRVKV